MVLTQLSAQSLQRSPLKLFDGSFAPSELLRDLPNALPIGETHDDHPTLIGGKAIDELEEQGTLLDLLHFILVLERGVRLSSTFPCRSAIVISDGIRCDPVQPCREGRAAPFESLQVCQCVLKDFGRQILGAITVAHPARDERVYALEVLLVQVGEATGILLGGLDPETLVLHRPHV
jgi:hypothetical protein